ncbi:MAG: two-component regulator propeller domain-containing protein, partial [Bacteroidota bacterium]
EETSSVKPYGDNREKSQTGRVNDLLKRNSGEILSGTRKGIEVHKGSSEEVHPFFKNDVLESYHVTALLEDKSGIIWVGTKYNGFFKIDLSPPKFNSVSTQNPNTPDSMRSYNFQSVFQDSDGYIWLGTRNEGLYKYHSEMGSVQRYVMGDDTSQSNEKAVFCLYQDQAGKLWAGTNNGLYHYSAGMDQFLKFDKDGSDNTINMLNNNNVYAIVDGFDEGLWIGTQFGLYRYNGQKIISYFHDPGSFEGLFADKVNALCTDEEGNVWIGTSGGLNVWDREDMLIRRISFSNRNPALKNVSILSLSLDQEGNILAGTRSGLWVVPDKKESPILMSGTDNLDNDMIKSVITDDSAQTWVGTNKGIAGIKPDGTVHNFDVFDGLPGYVFNNGSVFRNRSGMLFFGSTEGLVWFHPDSIQYNQIKPSMAFTDIRVVRRNEKTEVFWPSRESIEIKYRPFTNIRMEFSALEFTNPDRNKYKVFLQGYDSDWRSVTYDNSVSFSNLLPGDYTLKILGSNNDYTWSDTPLELDITVVPPLWMSNYALAFYFLAFIFVLHLFINYRVRHYRKANRELQEKTVNKKQIEAQREVLTRINRSLTDSINYARRIQRAMIPAESSLQSLFPESFVYLRARDIVSGDFYWFHEKDNKVFVTAVDCTGHGVPGAFMSIIGLDLLKNIVEVQGLESPSEILKTMNGELIRTLHKEQPAISSADNVSDGMDMSLVVVDKEEKTLEFAGAYNGFYLVRDNEIHSYKGDRFPVGYLKDGESPVFTRKKVELQEGDVVYMFSDGLPDQFGGPDFKKFKYRRFRLLLLSIHQMAFPDQKAIIHKKIEEWMAGEHEQVDDILVLGFKPLG